MQTYSAAGNKIYYIQTGKFINGTLIVLLLTEPYYFKDEYGCLVFSGFLEINGETVPFTVDTGFKNLHFKSISKYGVFLLENRTAVIKAFLPSFRKFYRNKFYSTFK